jgi:hypothetical protein
MENAPVQPQRSPWFYVLLGCGGLAALLCMGSLIVVFFFGKQVKNMTEGVNDPQERQKNAIEQLGALPEGYSVLASVSFFGMMKTTVLSDQPPLADGGIAPGGRTFNYFRIMANEQNKQTRAFFEGDDPEGAGLRERGIQFDAKAVIKRGELNVEGRKLRYVVSRGRMQGQESALTNAVLFDCPDDALRIAMWSQADPAPDVAPEKVDLTQTVADEAELARLLKPINPCGR